MVAAEEYEKLLTPSVKLIEYISTLKGSIMILGAGGKMGPSLALLARRAVVRAGGTNPVTAVARFSDHTIETVLTSEGVVTIKADLLNDVDLESVPQAENVLFLAGTKFGTSGNESYTWAMNTYVPARVAQKFKRSRIVVFSTGNVYPLVPIGTGGATEKTRPEPVGEYAQSCLGRERMFEFFSAKYETPILLYRLNYANDVTYGVLTDIARAVMTGEPIDLRMGYVNVIWQQDANEIALRCLSHCNTPPTVLNVTGSETLSVRDLAKEFGKIFKREPILVNEESETALLSNASECERLFGKPAVSTAQMIRVISGWIGSGGKTLNKPTHFQERKGNF